MDKQAVATVILAAGKGTRMKSDLPKVLHLLHGEPLVRHVVRTARQFAGTVIAVIGYKGEMVRDALAGDGVEFAWQHEQLGTAHAVMQAAGALEGFAGKVVVLSGDVPLISAETIRRLIALAEMQDAPVALLSAHHATPTGYGRVLRNADGTVDSIVEERDATPEQKKITEINGGIYVFDTPFLWDALRRIRPENDQKEYYLTDIVKIALASGKRVVALTLPAIAEVAGVNTVGELAELNAAAGRSGA